MIISCPYCHGELDIDAKQIGDRVHHARCDKWVLVGRHANGEHYGVKAQPPISIPERQRAQH